MTHRLSFLIRYNLLARIRCCYKEFVCFKSNPSILNDKQSIYQMVKVGTVKTEFFHDKVIREMESLAKADTQMNSLCTCSSLWDIPATKLLTFYLVTDKVGMRDVEKGVITRHSTAQVNQKQKRPEVCEPGLHRSRVIRLPFLSSCFSMGMEDRTTGSH